MSRQGEVLLHHRNSTRIDLYKYEDVSGTFTEMKQVDSPVDISSDNDCCLYIYDSQDATVALKNCKYSSSGVLVNTEGEKLQEWQQNGHLIGVWANKRRVYELQNDATTGWEVCVIDHHNTVNYLRPPSTHIWSSMHISACEDEATGNKAVCHAPCMPKEHTLETLNSDGKSHSIKS